MYDQSSDRLRNHVRRVERLEANQQEVQRRQVLPHAPRMTLLEWVIVISFLLIFCFALAYHFGLFF
jgi:hypothetical protein